MSLYVYGKVYLYSRLSLFGVNITREHLQPVNLPCRLNETLQIFTGRRHRKSNLFEADLGVVLSLHTLLIYRLNLDQFLLCNDHTWSVHKVPHDIEGR